MMKAFNQTVRYIEENLTEETDEKKIVYLSGYSFNTAFKKFHNVSPSKVKNGAGFKVFSPVYCIMKCNT